VLADAGEIDPARVAIRGDSAGGWTTLAALAHTDVFCAGAVYYPIADATRWSGGHTHDFESRYLDGLVRPADRERVSPLHHVDKITSPLVVLQGADDTICPPEHAKSVIAAVNARGLWHRLLIFDGEGHGFRKAGSVTASLNAELDLYSYAMHIDRSGLL
jgi:dipeptidyl aminopeptidase/acylaminoacyl peptidase